ncbi:MAG: hypothetical protein KF726_04205 [Anaerolineae bacterium]|nr:hypothetical protein [Anaerolineae bacterium]
MAPKILVIAMALLVAQLSFTPAAATTFAAENGLLKLTAAHYEIAFRESDGGIAYILDKTTNQNISEGSTDNNLWFASMGSNRSVNGSAYHIDYAWDEATSQLTLTFIAADLVNVTVTVDASDDQVIKLQAAVTNNAANPISTFRFPNELKVVEADVNDALMPLMPGALISSKFFQIGGTGVNEYPGELFADYLAINSARGKLTIYSLLGDALQPSFIGFEHLEDTVRSTRMIHNFRTWIETGKSWTSPWVVLNVGQDYPATIASYRTENGIDKYKSLTEKLGDAAESYFAYPMYKLDLAAIKQTFQSLQGSLVSKVTIPGLVHVVVLQKGGHDNTYPDIMPPDPKWGTTEEFSAFIEAVHAADGVVIPYVNLSWWDNKGPTLSALPADVKLFSLLDIKDSTGLPNFETYGPNAGFVVNLHNEFVKNKIAEQMKALTDAGVDGVFGDQWGNRAAPFDFNPAGLEKFDPATSYFEGIRDHFRTHADSKLWTETGVDVLADDGIGFMGTNYLWDIKGYRGKTAPYTSYYPMAGMLLRDKVLLYQHNLAAETWTADKQMLRWNLEQGYGLSNAFYDIPKGALNMDNPALNLVGVFQKYVLANYADQLVVSYSDLGNGVKETKFTDFTVYSNWNEDAYYTVNGNTLPAGGVVTQANDGSVTAGVFSSYNDAELSGGDHYLVEVRSANAIKVFQPLGADTELAIKNMEGWTSATVTAYQYDGTVIGTANAAVSADAITFTYAANVDGKPVGYYQITP